IVIRACGRHAVRLRAAHEGQAPLVEGSELTLIDTESDDGPTALEEVEKRERLEDLYQALEKLPPAQRAVFVLRSKEELTWEEIAALTDIPRSTVQGVMKYAEKALKFLLRKHLSASAQRESVSHDA